MPNFLRTAACIALLAIATKSNAQCVGGICPAPPVPTSKFCPPPQACGPAYIPPAPQACAEAATCSEAKAEPGMIARCRKRHADRVARRAAKAETRATGCHA
jgi:hypothetical protein